jgi:hypothetical protein
MSVDLGMAWPSRHPNVILYVAECFHKLSDPHLWNILNKISLLCHSLHSATSFVYIVHVPHMMLLACSPNIVFHLWSLKKNTARLFPPSQWMSQWVVSHGWSSSSILEPGKDRLPMRNVLRPRNWRGCFSGKPNSSPQSLGPTSISFQIKVN